MNLIVLLWFLLAATNFLIQILYFRNDSNRSLYRGKRITTPLLLWGAMLLILLQGENIPWIPCAILFAMGLGEWGIEGSRVVENRDSNVETSRDSLLVVAAGILFLLVNAGLGLALILALPDMKALGFGIPVGIVAVVLLTILLWCVFKPASEVRMQILAYSTGLTILAVGSFADLFAGSSILGKAGLILTVSDSLVLIRMAAPWTKDRSRDRHILLVFLIVILLLYYAYMVLLMKAGLAG